MDNRSGPENPKRLLMIRTDRIGDVILTTPAVLAVKQALPEVSLSVLVSPQTEPLLRGHPEIDQILIDDRAGRHRGLWGWLRLIGEIRRQRFDTVINFHTKRRTNLLCFLAGIPRRIGYVNEKWGFLLTDRIWDQRPAGDRHETRYCLDVLKALDIFSQDQTLTVMCRPQDEEWAEELFRTAFKRGRKILALHPGSSCPTKMWPAQRFTELANALVEEHHFQVVLIGADFVRPVAAEIRAGIKGNVLDLTGETSVAQLVSLLKRCDLLVSNDSGPVHIASALNVPVVSIFTRNQPGINPERWHPLGPRSRTVAPPEDLSVSFAGKGPDSTDYLESVGVEEVKEAVDRVLG